MHADRTPNGTTATPTRRTVAYIRVSTEEQGLEGYSLPDQERRASAAPAMWLQSARSAAPSSITARGLREEEGTEMRISSRNLRAWIDAKRERQQRQLQPGLEPLDAQWLRGYLACLSDLELWVEREEEIEAVGAAR